MVLTMAYFFLFFLHYSVILKKECRLIVSQKRQSNFSYMIDSHERSINFVRKNLSQVTKLVEETIH